MAALPPLAKERTKREMIIIYVIAARRWLEQSERATYRDKAKAPCVRKHRRVEATYSSVSVMDDAAKDALSQVKLPMTNHHG